MSNIFLGVLAVLCLVLGVLIFSYPERAIRFQIAFYRLINWRMEPISWEKEKMNTRFMGLTILVIALMTFGIIYSRASGCAWGLRVKD